MPPIPPLEALVIIGLASFRATWIVTTDTITEPFRNALYRWGWRPSPNGPEPRGARAWLVELLTCNWCLGVWVSAAAYCVWRWAGDVGLAVLAILAIAGLQGALAQLVVTAHEETED